MVSQVAELKSISINAKPKTPDPAHLYLGAYNVYYVKYESCITKPYALRVQINPDPSSL